MTPSFQAAASIFAVVSAVMGSYVFLDGRFAEENDLIAVTKNVKRVDTRLDNKIIGDQVHQLQKRMWALEERLGKHPKDSGAQKELRRLRSRKELLEHKQRVLIQKLEDAASTSASGGVSSMNTAPTAPFRSAPDENTNKESPSS